MSPDNQKMATAAGDEVIKFWNVFPKVKKEQSEAVSIESLQLR
jgi:WD40 repeat protein